MPSARRLPLLLLAAALPLLGWQVYRFISIRGKSATPTPATVPTPAGPVPLSIAAVPLVPKPWLLLFDHTVSPADRLALARQIDSSLPLAALTSQAARYPTLSENRALETEFTIYNEILDQARQRNLHPDTLTPFLISALKDAALHPVCRDYAAQHLSLWISARSAGAAHETDPARRREALESLVMIPGDPSVRQLSLPGTVLLAIADLADTQPADLTSHWPVLDASLISLASDPDTPSILRLAAVQTTALCRRAAVLPSLRSILADPASPEPLLMAVAGALGQLGDATDRPALMALSAAPARAAVATAAATALKRLP